jgi:spermidine synthase
MKSPYERLNYLMSFVTGKIIETASGHPNPYLEVQLINGRYVLNTHKVNYSFGNLHKVFREAFRLVHIERYSIRTVLVLGFGAGSIASILLDEYGIPCTVTGVEADAQVIRLYEKYFRRTGHPVNVVNEDAFQFMKVNRDTFDLIVIDIFVDDVVPEIFETGEFLVMLKNASPPGGLTIFNKMVHDEASGESAERLGKRMKGIWEESRIYPMKKFRSNRMFVCKKTCT